jgi:hypothetical protein
MKVLLAVVAVVLTFLTPPVALAQTTRFTYQGQLTDSGSPQATYQMRFRLFDALASGSQIGSTIENAAVAVDDGIFTVSLDFGANVFSGADRFLEIAVRRNGGEGYTVLSPRQQIASSPYAIRTLSAQTADLALDANKLGGVDASEYVTSGEVGGSFINNGTTLQDADFNIDGNGLIGGGLGVGVNAIQAGYGLDVRGSSWISSNFSTHYVVQTNGGTNSWARLYMRSPSQSWLLGTSQNFNGNQFYLVDETGAQSRMTIQPSGGPITFPFGNVGIGSTNPPAKLWVEGNVGQNAAGLGLPKAMVYALKTGSINRCYNAVTGSSVPPCGFSSSKPDPFTVRIDFGFPVYQSFFSLTFMGSAFEVGGIWTANHYAALTVNQIDVGWSVESGPGLMVIVY